MPKEFDKLIESRRIYEERISTDEVRRALERAERDLRTAKMIMAEDHDWGFAVAYNAVLQSSRAYMFAQGYRPASREGHKNTLDFMRLALGKRHEQVIGYFDRMRKKRNQVIYDIAGLISETEAENLLSRAEDFVRMIQKKLT